jgi:hypothetical protein
MATRPLPPPARFPDPHGWISTETLKTSLGDFRFEGGYPDADATQRLLDLQKLSRAIEVYSTQIMPVSEIATREGEEVDSGNHLGKPYGRWDGTSDSEH